MKWVKIICPFQQISTALLKPFKWTRAEKKLSIAEGSTIDEKKNPSSAVRSEKIKKKNT